jgi:hypothetical protein
MVVPAPDFDPKNDTLTVARIDDSGLFYYTKAVSIQWPVIFV